MIHTSISRVLFISTACLSFILTGSAIRNAAGQGKDMGCSPTVANPCTPSSGSSPSGGRSIWSRPSGLDPAVVARNKRLAEAHEANERGVALFNSGRYAEALKFFKEAHDKNPDSEPIKKNLANAQEAVESEERSAAESARQAKLSAEAARKMTDSMQKMADSLNAAPAASNLEFGDMKDLKDAVADKPSSLNYIKGPDGPCKQAAANLAFGDPMTVDARCVPSGLTKFIDDSIAKEFAQSPLGVGERVTKGFQSLMAQDRKAAKAWFEDALNRDPTNEGLKRVIDLIEDASQYQARPKVIKLAPTKPDQLILPTGNDLDLLLDTGQMQDFLALFSGPEKPSVQMPDKGKAAFLFTGAAGGPPQIVDFPHGNFRVYQSPVGSTIIYAEGPYVVRENGRVERSTDKDDLILWDWGFKHHPELLPSLKDPPKKQ